MSDTLPRRTGLKSMDGDLGRENTLSRRAVLGQMALWATVGAVGLGGCDSTDYSPLIAELVELTPDREAATLIGQTFLETKSMSRKRLASRLALELDWQPEVDRATLTTRLLDRIAGDFRDGKTVRVESWILSQTEVWWAALVAQS